MKKMLCFPLILLALAACAPQEDDNKSKTEDTKTVQNAAETTDTNPNTKSVSANRVFFLSPAQGARVKSPVKIKMGIEGMTVKPAGETAANTGHHHLLVDLPAIKAGDLIPKDAVHIHFGKGQTETEVELKPGKHKLTLQFADGQHHSYGPEMSASLDIEVE
ncbi:MAG: DUF4399 domain-containing protein [Candidatus Sericytochromatia bacterium]